MSQRGARTMLPAFAACLWACIPQEGHAQTHDERLIISAGVRYVSALIKGNPVIDSATVDALREANAGAEELVAAIANTTGLPVESRQAAQECRNGVTHFKDGKAFIVFGMPRIIGDTATLRVQWTSSFETPKIAGVATPVVALVLVKHKGRWSVEREDARGYLDVSDPCKGDTHRHTSNSALYSPGRPRGFACSRAGEDLPSPQGPGHVIDFPQRALRGNVLASANT